MMASSLWKLCNGNITGYISSSVCGSVRHGHHLREQNYKDPSLHFRVDIGLPPSKVAKKKISDEQLKILKHNRQSETLEKLARNREQTEKDWLKTAGPHHIKLIADHYGVYQHLFGDAYFYSRVPLHISYNLEDGELPVYFGNVIKPSDSSAKPNVQIESNDESLWTLILTNPDGHFTQEDGEYVHWFVGNIPGNNIEKGETVVEYLQPFPPKGTGYHRHVFILYKQSGKLNFSDFRKEGSCLTLSERTFSTYDFYRTLQDSITPSALAFFQSDWDSSLKHFYHNILNMKEPIFEYDFPPPYIRKQKWFPLKQPFNLYMDKYRDPKQINKEFLMRKLKNVHPFKEPPAPLPYPNAQYFEGYVPSWLKLEIKKSRLKWGRINDIE